MAENLNYDFGKDLHYKKSVTTLGNQKMITCKEDIYADNGVKLIAKGAKVDSKVYANLVKHKLQKDLEESITLEDPITPSIVASDLEALVSSSKTLSKLLDTTSKTITIKELLLNHTFPENIALKLTVAKSERPNLYNHSLVVVFLTYFLANMANLDDEIVTTSILAALFHDIGLLHIDPKLFEDSKKLSNSERKYLHVHVIISHLLINKYEVYQTGISDAIIEHHERLDGSGYPLGKHADDISIPGQILAIAEVMASKFNTEGECIQTKELSILLTLNCKKLNPNFYQYWQQLFNTEEPDTQATENYSNSELIAQASRLNKVLKEWLSIVERLPKSELIDFIDSYIKVIYNNVLESGMNIDNSEYLASLMAEDRTISIFFHLHMKEHDWQLKNLLAELNRRNIYQRTQQDTQIGPWLNSVIQFANKE